MAMRLPYSWFERTARMTAFDESPPIQAADLFCDGVEDAEPGWHTIARGLLVTAAVVLAAAFLSEHYGPPLTLMGLLLGMALNFLGNDRKLAPGLAFASGKLLRIGIVLIGLRVTAGQIVDLGPEALLAVIATVAATIGSGIVTSRLLGLGGGFGALAGGAVGICGASAALALALVLGERRAGKAQLAIVLVGISLASAAAMALYPVLARDLGLTDRQAGFFLGASIHDVAQALGAGYTYSEVAGQTATVVKLARVVLLAPVLTLVGLLGEGRRRSASQSSRVPWFVLGFLVAMAVNSTGVVPATIGHAAGDAGSLLIAFSVTAAGIRAPVAQLREIGWRPMVPIVVATLVAASCAFAAALIVA